MLAVHHTWSTLASTGRGAAIDTHGLGREHTMLVASSGSTATVSFEVARSSGGPWASLGSTTVESSALVVIRETGPFRFIAPRVQALSNTNGITIELLALE